MLSGPVTKRVPRSVRHAVHLMYAGAALYAMSGIVGLVSLVTGSAAVSGALPAAVVVISILVPVVLWLWMARGCRAGRPWARVWSTILFAVATIATLGLLGGSAGAWALLGAIVSWFIGLAVVVLLWQRSSSAYFRV